MPMPVSATRIATDGTLRAPSSRVDATDTVTRPPLGVYVTALPTRFRITCVSRAAAAVTQDCAPRQDSIVRPLASADGAILRTASATRLAASRRSLGGP